MLFGFVPKKYLEVKIKIKFSLFFNVSEDSVVELTIGVAMPISQRIMIALQSFRRERIHSTRRRAAA